jgi:hypothetical protein
MSKKEFCVCGDVNWQFAPGRAACNHCLCDDCPEGPCYDCSGECPPEYFKIMMDEWRDAK